MAVCSRSVQKAGRSGFGPGGNDFLFTDRFLYAYVFNGRNGYNLLHPRATGDEIIPVGVSYWARLVEAALPAQ